jgi:hypothetical protein
MSTPLTVLVAPPGNGTSEDGCVPAGAVAVKRTPATFLRPLPVNGNFAPATEPNRGRTLAAALR